ncbi:MAG: CaiB/BaiF CoA transferase family protein, partial [Candidatus Binataceae bacterium]
MAKLPLEGVRIADFTWVWAGPYCTLQLAHLGADVIRIETRTRPCVTRLLPPWPEGKPGINRSGYFNQYNQGKRSVTLNYAKPGALEIAHRLVEASDVVTNNFAAGVMDKMGLGYAALRKIKPDLIMISLSGYGDTGPYHEYVAYGPAQVPLSGLSSLTGYKGWPPMHAGFSYADPNAGVHGAFALLAALYHRQKTGEGQYIDMSQWECAMGLLPEGIMDYTMNGREPERDGNRDPMIAPHGVFPSKDRFENTGVMIDMWVSIVAADDAEFGRLAGAIGRPELARDPRFATAAARKQNEDELEAAIAAWTSQRSAAEAEQVLQAAGVAAAI